MSQQLWDKIDSSASDSSMLEFVRYTDFVIIIIIIIIIIRGKGNN